MSCWFLLLFPQQWKLCYRNPLSLLGWSVCSYDVYWFHDLRTLFFYRRNVEFIKQVIEQNIIIQQKEVRLQSKTNKEIIPFWIHSITSHYVFILEIYFIGTKYLNIELECCSRFVIYRVLVHIHMTEWRGVFNTSQYSEAPETSTRWYFNNYLWACWGRFLFALKLVLSFDHLVSDPNTVAHWL